MEAHQPMHPGSGLERLERKHDYADVTRARSSVHAGQWGSVKESHYSFYMVLEIRPSRNTI